MNLHYCLRALLCPLLLAAALAAGGQVRTHASLTGTVADESTKRSIEGAFITALRSHRRVITDENGHFRLAAISSDTLLVTSVGYLPKKVQAEGTDSILLIELAPADGQLQEVTVNTGYQRLPKERATGSFDVVDNALLNRRVSTNVLDKIENLTPGILFDRNAGAPDALLIRGRSTIYANAAPLIVVDNFPYDGDISSINPNDVESLTVLKDAAAASIWGARAGNGVIIISTKKGKTAKPRVELNTSVTLQGKPDLFNVSTISSADYIELEQDLFAQGYYANDELYDSFNFGHPPFTPVIDLLRKERKGQINPGEANTLINSYKGGDVRKDISKYLYRRGVNQQHALNVSGNTGNLNYYMSAGWDDNQQNLVGANYNRVSLRSSNTFTVTKRLQVSLGMTYTESISRNGNNPGFFLNSGAGKGLYPYARLVNPDGSPATLVKDNNSGFTDTAGSGLLPHWTYQPIADIGAEKHSTTANDFVINAGVLYNLLTGLSLELRYQYETVTGAAKDDYTASSYYARNIENGFAQVDYVDRLVTLPVPTGGILDFRDDNTSSHQGRAQLNYGHRFGGRHEIAAVGGWEIRDYTTEETVGRLYGYEPERSTVNNLIDYLTPYPLLNNVSLTSQVPNPSSISQKSDRFLSYYFNGSYTYRDRYILSLSARHDAANLFGVAANERGTPLWSTGGAWLVNNEPFYHAGWLPRLKLRATYGYNGNIARNATAYTTSIFTYPYSTPLDAALIQNPPNSHLQWEKVRMLNLGIDFGTKNNRVSGTVEYYRKKATDLLGQAPLDPTLGVSSSYSNGTSYYFGNVAGMKGQGWDVQVTSRNIARKFTWTTDWVFSNVHTAITDYQLPAGYGSLYLTPNTINPVKGKPVYSVYSFPWAGLDGTTGAAQGIVSGKKSEDYATIFSSTPLDSMVYNGPVQPTYFGAVRNTFGWKQFSLSFNISYKLGYYFRRSSINYSALFSSWTGSGDYAKRWQQPGDEAHTNVPSLVYPANPIADAFYQYASVLVEKGDHLRLEDITLSYDLNKASMPKLPFAHVRLYAYAGNLWVLWTANKEHIDPYYNNVPSAGKTLSLGVNISF